MPHPSKALVNVEDTLHLVIEQLIDGQEGFQTLGEDLKDEDLKRFFLAESLTRAQFRGELETILHQEGVRDIEESGTMAGVVHRAWGDLKSKLGGGDHALLVTAEEGEDAAKQAYTDALHKDLPLPVRQVLATQAAHIQNSHNFIKSARDTSK